MLDKYDVEKMNALSIEMLEVIESPNERAAASAKVIAKLEEMKQRGEEWGKQPNIPFRMGSMDYRDLDERIIDNTKVIGDIERRITALKLWST